MVVLQVLQEALPVHLLMVVGLELLNLCDVLVVMVTDAEQIHFLQLTEQFYWLAQRFQLGLAHKDWPALVSVD